MSQNKSLGHIRDHTMDQMEIRTADGSGSHLDDNIIIILYLRFPHILHLYILYSFIHQCFQYSIIPYPLKIIILR